MREQQQDSSSLSASEQEEMRRHKQEVLEEFRVQTSPEYKATARIVQTLHRSIGSRILTHITTIALITAKIQERIDVSWWIVFIPIWISLGLPMLQAFFVCCGSCCRVVEEESMEVASPDNDEENVKKNENAKDKNDTNPIENELHEEELQRNTTVNVSSPTIMPPMEEQYDFDIYKNRKTEDADVHESGLFVGAEGDIQDFVNANDNDNDVDDEDLMAEPELDASRESHNNDFDNDSKNQTLPTTTFPSSNLNEQSSSASANAPSKIAETTQLPVVDKLSEDVTATPSENMQLSQQSNNTDDMNETVDAEKKNQSKGNEASAADGGDEEEAFRKFWEEMQRQAEEDDDILPGENMESTAFASISCCTSCFQIMMLCLIVGKLEQAYDVDDDPDTANGYNAFWILFPIFFVAGLILLCCACCIYAKVPENEHDDDEKVGRGKQTTENAVPSKDNDASPAVAIPLAAPDTKSASDHGLAEEEPRMEVPVQDSSAPVVPSEPSSHSRVSDSNDNLPQNSSLIIAPSDEMVSGTIENVEKNKNVEASADVAVSMDDLD